MSSVTLPGEDTWKLVSGSPRPHATCPFFLLIYLLFAFTVVHCSWGCNPVLSPVDLPTSSPPNRPGGGLEDLKVAESK